jgi:rod shape-determining protein MreC
LHFEHFCHHSEKKNTTYDGCRVKRYTPQATELALSPKSFGQRAVAWFLLLGCLALFAISAAQHPRLQVVRQSLMEITAPALMLASEPARAWHNLVRFWQDVNHLYAENQQLKSENDALKQWQSVARALEAENNELRRMVGYQPVESTAFITGRIVGQTYNALGQRLLLNVGFNDGVRAHQAVVASDGLVGRVTEISENTARVILLTDVNARVPVIGVESREKAVLAGNGESMPVLKFTTQNSRLRVGEALVTTEDGGVMPAGIAVGQIFSRDSKNTFHVRAGADVSRTGYVRVVSHDTPFGKAANLPQQ